MSEETGRQQLGNGDETIRERAMHCGCLVLYQLLDVSLFVRIGIEPQGSFLSHLDRFGPSNAWIGAVGSHSIVQKWTSTADERIERMDAIPG